MLESVIQYKGDVTIKIKDKPKVKQHNEGTFHLFNLLNRIFSKSVYELTDLGSLLPCYISILPHVDNIITAETLRETPNYEFYKNYSIIIKELPILNKQIIGNSVKYSTVLTTSLMNNYITTLVDKTGYPVLLDANCSNILAFSEIDLSILQTMYNDSLGQAEIDWEISFNNSLKENDK